MEKREQLYTVKEVANILQKSNATILRYIRNKELNAIKVGNSWRIADEDLGEFLKPQTKKEAQE